MAAHQLASAYVFFRLRENDCDGQYRLANSASDRKERTMGLILLIVLIVLLLGGLPTWGYSRDWGYRPSGALGLVLVIVLILLLLGYIPRGF
jgi:hypothetical protein